MKPKSRKGDSEVPDEGLKNAFRDYEDAEEPEADSKYQCRYCGMLFDTLEEYERHHRQVHDQGPPLPLVGMPM